MVSFNLASAWEAVSDDPDEDALICGDVSPAGRDSKTGQLVSPRVFASPAWAPGTTWACACFNCSEYLEAEFGAMKQRCSPFNVNYRYTAGRAAALLDDADARAVFFSADLVERFADSTSAARRASVRSGRRRRVPDWASGTRRS